MLGVESGRLLSIPMNTAVFLRHRGFTLVELMVTISIAAMLMFAVMPSVGGWMRDLRIRTAAESVQNGLERARMEALRTNEPVSLWLVSDADSDGCVLSAASSSWVVAVDTPAGACVSSAASFVDKHEAGNNAAGVTVSAVQTTSAMVAAGATRITFNGFGQIATPGGGTNVVQVVVDFTHAAQDARPLRVEVLSGGGIRMCDPNVPGGDTRRCTL